MPGEMIQPLSDDKDFLAALARGEKIRRGKSPAELAALEAGSDEPKPPAHRDDEREENPPAQAQA